MACFSLGKDLSGQPENAQLVEIKHFDADSLSHTSFKRRSQTWRQVKDKLKAAIKTYNNKCKKITEKLKKIDKFKKGDTFR